MNPYLVLGVDESISDKELKTRYKAVCKMFHPDKYQGDKSAVIMFQIVQDAYDKIKYMRKKVRVEEVVIECDSKELTQTHQIPVPNISHTDINALSQWVQNSYFHPDFNLMEYFQDVQVQKK